MTTAKTKTKVKAKATSKPSTPTTAEKTLRPTNEIMFAMMFHKIHKEERELLLLDPSEYLYSRYNMELLMEIIIAENTDKLVHIALPYYRPQLGAPK